MNHVKAISFTVTLSLLLVFAGCREVPTSVKVEPGPSFLLAGSGRLATFTVFSPRAGEKIAFPDQDVAVAVWRVTAAQGYFRGAPAEGLRLTYGKAPPGYGQLVPSQPQAAAPLAPGAVYSFVAETTDAPIASGYFYMGKSGPFQTTVPDLCVTFVGRNKVRVRCKLNTNEPYREPTDLEKYAEEHQSRQ